MKTSLAWLRDFVDFPWSASELADRLTAVGLEVEGIEEFGNIAPKVVCAKIVERSKHENSDNLSICQVDIGDSELLQIVCGAPNCDAGQKAALAMIGCDLGGGFVIKKSRLRGEDSYGMLCSAKELGLGDDADGILILPEDTPLGTELDQLFEAVQVIDWEVTPNRADWLSHIGIAREIAAINNCEIKIPAGQINYKKGSKVEDIAKVSIEDKELCPRYIARVFENVKVAPSPDWLVERLRSVGINPINNVVDITNYILMEFGQPLHAFDLDTLAGKEIIVRRAAEGEKIVTLDETKLTLNKDTLLIADRDRAVALAGIMGAENSMISDTTVNVLLEAACFNKSNIRISSRKLGISSDSSYLFERGVSAEQTALASERAAQLLCELTGAVQLEGVIDCYPGRKAATEIDCRIAKVNALLGIELSSDEIVDCLKRRGIKTIEQNSEKITLLIPDWRDDLQREVDIIEEVAQIRGLDSIPEASVTAHSGGSIKDDESLQNEQVRDALLALGLNEIYNYTLYPLQECQAGSSLSDAEFLQVSNPISQDAAYLRPSLFSGLLNVVNHNVSRNIHNIAIFEMGRVFQRKDKEMLERMELAIALTGRRNPERFAAEREQLLDFYDMKGILESWLDSADLKNLRCEAAEHNAFKKTACASIAYDNKILLHFGEVDKKWLKGIRLRAPLFIALIDLQAVLDIKSAAKKYQELPLFPGTARDITLVAAPGLTHQDILDTINELKLPILESVELVDVFEDEKVLGKGRRSMTYSISFCNPQRTLKDDEVNQMQERIRKELQNKLKVELR